MIFTDCLLEGRLVKRYKRFLVDVELMDGSKMTAYCPNTGSMLGCNIPGSPVWLSKSDNPARKYQYTLEIVKVNNCLIGVNTSRPNDLAEDAIKAGVITSLGGFNNLRREVKYGKENSRIDILLEYSDINCYVEVKNVTLVEGKVAFFPDSVTVRGQKHLRELMHAVDVGNRGVIFFCVQHTGAKSVEPADHIDKKYGELLRLSAKKGVEILAYQADVSPKQIVLTKEIPVNLR